MFYFTCDRSLIQATDYNTIAIIIIAIMTRSWLWSVAKTLCDVHVPRRSATSFSNWLGFPRRPAVSMSSGDVPEVFTSQYPDNDQPSLQQLVPVLGELVWWCPV